MGDLQHVEWPGVDRHRLGLRIGSQQHLEVPPASKQDEALGVGVLGQGAAEQLAGRPENLESQRPGAQLASLGDAGGHRTDGSRSVDQSPAGLAVDKAVHRQRSEQFLDAASVVGLVMGYDRGSQRARPQIPELGAQVVPGRPAVDQQRRSVGGLEQDRVALPMSSWTSVLAAYAALLAGGLALRRSAAGRQ